MENPLECAKVAKTQQQDNTTLHNTKKRDTTLGIYVFSTFYLQQITVHLQLYENVCVFVCV